MTPSRHKKSPIAPVERILREILKKFQEMDTAGGEALWNEVTSEEARFQEDIKKFRASLDKAKKTPDTLPDFLDNKIVEVLIRLSPDKIILFVKIFEVVGEDLEEIKKRTTTFLDSLTDEERAAIRAAKKHETGMDIRLQTPPDQRPMLKLAIEDLQHLGESDEAIELAVNLLTNYRTESSAGEEKVPHIEMSIDGTELELSAQNDSYPYVDFSTALRAIPSCMKFLKEGWMRIPAMPPNKDSWCRISDSDKMFLTINYFILQSMLEESLLEMGAEEANPLEQYVELFVSREGQGSIKDSDFWDPLGEILTSKQQYLLSSTLQHITVIKDEDFARRILLELLGIPPQQIGFNAPQIDLL